MPKYVSITDDNESDLTLAKFLVENEGLIAVCKSNGFATLESTDEYEFCMFVIDLQMPQLKGIDLIKRIRGLKNFQQTPILVMSSRKETKDVKLAVEAGATDYIIKPIDHMIFKTKICTLTGTAEDKWSDFDVPDDDQFSEASVLEKCRAKSINELGLTVHAPFPLEVGQSREFSAGILDKLGIDKVTASVKSCTKINSLFEIKVQFIGMTEVERKKIRLYCREISTKKNAS